MSPMIRYLLVSLFSIAVTQFAFAMEMPDKELRTQFEATAKNYALTALSAAGPAAHRAKLLQVLSQPQAALLDVNKTFPIRRGVNPPKINLVTLAAKAQDNELFKKLIALGVNVNAANDDPSGNSAVERRTPVHMLANEITEKPAIDVVDACVFIAEHSEADFWKKDMNGHCALDTIAENCQLQRLSQKEKLGLVVKTALLAACLPEDLIEHEDVLRERAAEGGEHTEILNYLVDHLEYLKSDRYVLRVRQRKEHALQLPNNSAFEVMDREHIHGRCQALSLVCMPKAKASLGPSILDIESAEAMDEIYRYASENSAQVAALSDRCAALDLEKEELSSNLKKANRKVCCLTGLSACLGFFTFLYAVDATYMRHLLSKAEDNAKVLRSMYLGVRRHLDAHFPPPKPL